MITSIKRKAESEKLKNIMSEESKQPKGYVLISVMIILTVMVTMMYFFSDALFSEQAIANNQKSATVGFHLAEAGVQEAIWRIQNDTTTRNIFLNSTTGLTTVSHSNFMTNGSYTTQIQNTAKGAATISVTGLYQTGLKQAQRRITLNVIQATSTGTYDQDAGLFVGGPNPGDIYMHNMNVSFGGSYDRAGISGGGDIDISNASVSVTKDILANGDITTKNSSVSLPPAVLPVPPGFPGGVQEDHYATDFVMPGIDISSSDPGSYKSLAQAQNQYYTSAQFATLLNTKTTFSGVVYVAGSGGVTIKNKNLTINGALVSEGSISVTNANVDINHDPAPSGLITLGSFNVTNANINIEGLVYVGVQAAAATNASITVTGAILTHDFSGNNCNLTINFKKDWVNETLAGGSTVTPVIKMEHWEEEY